MKLKIKTCKIYERIFHHKIKFYFLSFHRKRTQNDLIILFEIITLLFGYHVWNSLVHWLWWDWQQRAHIQPWKWRVCTLSVPIFELCAVGIAEVTPWLPTLWVLKWFCEYSVNESKKKLFFRLKFIMKSE